MTRARLDWASLRIQDEIRHQPLTTITLILTMGLDKEEEEEKEIEEDKIRRYFRVFR